MKSTSLITGFAPVHNGSLYYEVAGSGPPVLLIHAGVADCTMWDDQFNLFSQNYRVIRYDTRGFGKSRTETTGFSNRQDIVDLFNHLGVERACVIGISRGGQIAIEFTLEHPERVFALVAVAAGVSGYDYHPDGSEKAIHEIELFNHMDELWEKKSFDELADLEVHAWADGPSQPIGRASARIREYLHKIIRANYTRQDGQVTPQPLSPLATSRLAEIHVPTLVLVGDYDKLVILEMADYLEKGIPGARKIVFPDTAHMIPLEQPEKFNELILDFLNRQA
jgi:pimeloyl-ACP methyl ester carboxylesterase